MSPAEKAAAIRARFADLDVSVGYIGNCGPGFDDRSWRVFTNLRRTCGYSVSVHLESPDFDFDKVCVALERIRAQRAFHPEKFQGVTPYWGRAANE